MLPIFYNFFIQLHQNFVLIFLIKCERVEWFIIKHVLDIVVLFGLCV